jgi:hypothetical protein
VGLEVFAVGRPDVELYARWMEEEKHLARATIGRRLSTVVGFYRYAVIDGYLADSPAEHVRRPKIDTESTTGTGYLPIAHWAKRAVAPLMRHCVRSIPGEEVIACA